MTGRVEFTISGDQKIHCAGCEHRIERALRNVPGVQQVRADADTQQVVATIDRKQVAPQQVRGKLADLGYQANVSGGTE